MATISINDSLELTSDLPWHGILTPHDYEYVTFLGFVQVLNNPLQAVFEIREIPTIDLSMLIVADQGVRQILSTYFTENCVSRSRYLNLKTICMPSD